MRTLLQTFAVSMYLIAAPSSVQSQVADARYSTLAARLFPMVEMVKPSLLSPDARKMLSARQTRVEACGEDTNCVLRQSVWTGEEISLLARASEASIPHPEQVDGIPDDGVASQITRELLGLNSILQVYGLGLPSRNPEIDGPMFKVGGTPFATRVSDAIAIIGAGHVEMDLDQSVALALALLDVNGRTEAADFEPLDAKYNEAALVRARTLDWRSFQYSAIVVLGNGPELTGERLSPRGKLRVRIAAERFFQKAAPFIIVSGGAVHPRGTAINEAIEMRRALIEWYGVPAENIIIEPYARYTYTNLRNSVRRLHAIGAPLEKKALIISDPEHTKYVRGPELAARAKSILGYSPGVIEPTSSGTGSAFIPSKASLRIDPLDPLDP